MYFYSMHLFEYTDYRLWLKERSEEIKKEKPFFSYRYIAGKLGINAGLIARIFNGQSHLTLKHVSAVAALFELSAVEGEYFDELVRFCRAKRSQDWERHYARMQCIRGENFTTIADSQAEYYSCWHHNAMRTLLSIYDFNGKNYGKLGALMVPPISAEQARESVELLVSLGLAEMGEDGFYKIPDSFISTGENWKAAMIQSFQKEMIEHSARAVDTLPRSARDVSSLTLPLAESILPAMKERVREFRQELLLMARDCEVEDSVFQVIIQLYPLARLRRKK
jgi:uncharacterized protein (TIGR02147 family)